ncbi:MAG: signal peptidase II, partial [Candidatus Latescibacteria bacterium]|nr:signal peptidase II [Candidatus Latescibacterota bacterium]
MKKSIYKYGVLLLVLLAGCNADIHTKRWAAKTVKHNSPITFVDGYLELYYVENDAMGFSMLHNMNSSVRRPLLTGLTVAATLVFIFTVWFMRKHSFFYILPFFIILAGAFGNLADKIRYGYVIDFIHFHIRDIFDWPFIFN